MVRWEAFAGVTHAWIAQCEGYVSLCGREVSGFGGQRSGIRCGQCTVSSRWAEQTGKSSYLTPQREPWQAEAPALRPPRRRARRAIPEIVIMAPSPAPVPSRAVALPTMGGEPRAILDVVPPLVVPASLEVYQALPEPEQRYWAPVMLARRGQDAVWDQAEETAEQFQQRCYDELSNRTHLGSS